MACFVLLPHPGADAAAPAPAAHPALTTEDAAASEPLAAQPHHSHPHLAVAAAAPRHGEPALRSPAHEIRRHSMVPHGTVPTLLHHAHHGSRQPLLGAGHPHPPGHSLANHRHVHPLLQRHRSEDRPLLRHAHRPSMVGCQRHLTKPLLQRPLLTHAHSVQQAAGAASTPHHHAPHHHHSHPRLSQKYRQKLFSRSKQYTSVCSGGSNSTTHCAGDSGTRSRSSREHADDDVEACVSVLQPPPPPPPPPTTTTNHHHHEPHPSEASSSQGW
uniref:Uncharacterized protein n=1 Tax=Anopheles melas TaxID=34690 RepID=A0A182TQL9_9DIPT